MNVTAIILAAGLSRRMGKENKLFLPFRENRIIDTVIDQIKKSQAYRIVIVGSKLSIEKLRQFSDQRTTVVDNPDFESGMTSSIQAGVQNARTTDGYMICLGDQPTISTETYDQIIATFKEEKRENENVIVVPFHENKKGNPVVFSSAYRNEILNHKEPEGCKKIVHSYEKNLVKVNVSEDSILFDIDNHEQYDKLRKLF